MHDSKERRTFSVREMAHACGVSRSTLLRMAEDGFLTPYRIDPDSGYRYYDMQNVTAVGQYQRMQTIGLSRKEIADLYYERVDSAAFLNELLKFREESMRTSSSSRMRCIRERRARCVFRKSSDASFR